MADRSPQPQPETGDQTPQTSRPTAGIGPNRTLRIVVAALTVVLIVAAVLHPHKTEVKLLGAVLMAALGVITVTDIEARRIPNLITGPGCLIALAIGAIFDSNKLLEQLVAGLATGLLLLVVAVVARGGFGMGDVKLGAMLGCFLGLGVVDALMLGFVLAGVVSLVILLRDGWNAGRHVSIFLGPYMALGAVVAFFVVTPFVD